MSGNRIDTQLGGITDLTLLTPIRAGLVEAPESITYVQRLRTVLGTINAMRQASRESSNPPSPFTDVVTRFRIVHSFRWAVIDPPPGSGEPARLLLNVCFDGGWEPYMRVIWRDLGTTLDLILCHSIDYKLSREVGFEEYARWVRANEVPASFLYLESQRTVMDHEYLASAEALVRSGGADDLAVTRLRTPSPGDYPPLPAQGPASYALGVSALPGLAALHGLRRFFTIHPERHHDGWCLLRAAQDILFELRKLDTTKLFPPGDPVRNVLYEMLDWFEGVVPQARARPERLDFDAAEVQGGMLTGYPDLAGGDLLLLMVVPGLEQQALAWLAHLPVTTEADVLEGRVPPMRPFCNVSLSLCGLSALGATQALIDSLPQAFREGMEQRAGVLGDLRGNHPQHWKLPRREDGRPADPSAVHIVVQLRWRDAGRADAQAFIDALNPARDGVALLHRQAMVRNKGPGGVTQEAFGFMDGISQPSAAPDASVAGLQWTDEVPRGELLLGWRTSRDAMPVPAAPNPLLDKGSFLVIRKLRQYVDRLRARLDQQAAALGLPKELLQAKMMGRWPDGRPVVASTSTATNDFNYAADAQGSRCPFHAHVRRANPRAIGAGGQVALPRLLRRGMSYGAPGDEDRGLLFMAYNANIAEQFEVVQRWMAGANSTGGYSGQADPFLGVPTPGQSRVLRVEHEGQAFRLDLGDQPFVELEWGGYYFVPSMPALRDLGAAMAASVPRPSPSAPRDRQVQLPPRPGNRRDWQVWLETAGADAWAYVRQQGGVLDTAFGVLVGSDAAVQEVLHDDGGRFSVTGYGRRMHESIGVGFLGEDPAQGHDLHAPAINKALQDIDEGSSFSLARTVGQGVLAQLHAMAQAAGQDEVTVDLEAYASAALAELTRYWFGIPDGLHVWAGEPHIPDDPRRRCPAGFMFVSRHVFDPSPRPEMSELGIAAGHVIKEQTAAWLATNPTLPPLSAAIVAAARPFVTPQDPDMVERTLAGIILGFAPTVLGNVLMSFGTLVALKDFWSLQALWRPGPEPFAASQALLRQALVKTLIVKGAPAMVWRVAASNTELAGLKIDKGRVVVVGLVSALAEHPNHLTAFGGPRPPAANATVHACSGYNIGMGVLQGLLAALLEAGPMRPTASPVALTWQLRT
ncbi:MAG: Dyp-type peroxidase [Paucibacter sp.]|nr:Dyp-type peroxidase [Roseateles sp.]